VLRRRFRPISLDDLTRALQRQSVPPRSVVVTFDDGYADNLYHAKPLLEQYKIPATLFASTGHLGGDREFWWDELDKLLLQPSQLPESVRLRLHGEVYEWRLDGATQYDEQDSLRHRRWRAWEEPPTPRHHLYYSLWQLLQRSSDAERQAVLHDLASWAGIDCRARSTHRSLTVDELRTLAQSDGLDVGAHTMSHTVLATLPGTEQQEEIFRSKQFLEQILKRPVTTFAYPYGKPSDYTGETMAIVEHLGFTAACTNVPGLVSSGVNYYELPRVHAHDWDGEEFFSRVTQEFDRG
nr:polysaccharide deacetylase family protein [Nitrospirales bacterium]